MSIRFAVEGETAILQRNVLNMRLNSNQDFWLDVCIDCFICRMQSIPSSVATPLKLTFRNIETTFATAKMGHGHHSTDFFDIHDLNLTTTLVNLVWVNSTTICANVRSLVECSIHVIVCVCLCFEGTQGAGFKITRRTAVLEKPDRVQIRPFSHTIWKLMLPSVQGILRPHVPACPAISLPNHLHKALVYRQRNWKLQLHPP